MSKPILVAEFTDGPLDGHAMPIENILDQVVIVMRDKVLRYEVYQEITRTVIAKGVETYYEVQRLVETRDKESFDEDLLEELKK